MMNTIVIASKARQSTTLAQPLDCHVASLLAMTSSLRAFASLREPQPFLSLTPRRQGAKGEVSSWA
jgi:hypothetical protein